MLTSLIKSVCILALFAVIAVALPADAATADAALEWRQFTTIGIVGIVCVIGGVWLFVKTAH